ncbi:bacteriocin-type signal sequence [Staphylococcus pragensis]|uniref:Bacteriocin-type signal sequence n=1 Tax=Staphylococcus pragensis TaxID=1611836 RepID=A0A4Z1BH27_9STAP|nr:MULTISPECIES: bacteriocin-type signal sequence [Staphylococcus]RTX91964.1 bacteriocin-type signal sequence [Staphylococcus carnosus]TGN26957.1 bacteriocin-type signal sequence [Staphylococcus pragensis]GGG94168.1 hypothetical protein GCM10007342_16590 [Staphylococcus pragensis]
MKKLNNSELKVINGGKDSFIDISGDIREIGQMINNGWKDVKDGWNGNHEEG